MTSESAALNLHRGETVHRRFTPFSSSFRYRLALIDLDIDRLDEANLQTWLFSVERPAMFSFRRRDHAGFEKRALRPWAEATLLRAGVTPPTGSIRLITFPRHLFYKFAPISLWIAHDETGSPAAIIYEVRNTFGECHSYVAALEGSRSRHEAQKSFHVSPFFDVSGTYQFSLRITQNGLHLGVTTIAEGQPVHSASLSTNCAPASDKDLAAVAIGMPFSTIGVTMGIHWEALKLWIKGARYHPRPKIMSEQTSAKSLSERSEDRAI